MVSFLSVSSLDPLSWSVFIITLLRVFVKCFFIFFECLLNFVRFVRFVRKRTFFGGAFSPYFRAFLAFCPFCPFPSHVTHWGGRSMPPLFYLPLFCLWIACLRSCSCSSKASRTLLPSLNLTPSQKLSKRSVRLVGVSLNNSSTLWAVACCTAFS